MWDVIFSTMKIFSWIKHTDLNLLNKTSKKQIEVILYNLRFQMTRGESLSGQLRCTLIESLSNRTEQLRGVCLLTKRIFFKIPLTPPSWFRKVLNTLLARKIPGSEYDREKQTLFNCQYIKCELCNYLGLCVSSPTGDGTAILIKVAIQTA